jgi:alpha-aminoadipate carrier protein LysW
MATCPECDAELEVDETDLDVDDEISCSDCGTNLRVTSISPLEFEASDEDDEDEDDDEADDDDEEDFEDDDEVDDAEEGDSEKEDWDE